MDKQILASVNAWRLGVCIRAGERHTSGVSPRAMTMSPGFSEHLSSKTDETTLQALV